MFLSVVIFWNSGSLVNAQEVCTSLGLGLDWALAWKTSYLHWNQFFNWLHALLKSSSLSWMVLSPPSRSSLWMDREDPGPLTYTWSFSHSVSLSLTQPYLTLGLRLAESTVPSEISVSSWTHYYSFLSWSLSSAWERGQMGLSLFSYALKYMKLKCVLVEDERNPCCS